MPKEGTTEKTTTEIVTEDGQKKRKTTTVTTTVTKTPEGGYSTKTSTVVKTETLGDDDDGSSKGGKSKLSDKMDKLKVGDSSSDDEKKHDGKNDLSRSDTDRFRTDLRSKINELRRRHGASGLKIGSDLEKEAQEHADKMLKKNKISLKSGDHGQTLAMKLPRPKGDTIAEMWYNGKEEYDFDAAKFSQATGNFTQMVWCGSEKIGIGVSSNKDGATYIIALYQPAGNVQGRFKENVKREK